MKDKTVMNNVKRELEFDPKVNAEHIGVSSNNGAVTLSGYVPTYAERRAAVSASERVYGVQAIADEIEVRFADPMAHDDHEISEAIATSFRSNLSVPEAVRAEVSGGFVTLRGEVAWHYQRDEADRAVRNLRGVKGVTNLITVKAHVRVFDVDERVSDALKRSADLDARSIWITAQNGTVHLHGHVHSFHERRAAENAAYAAPGVSVVDNQLTITP